MSLSESDTRAKLIDPALHKCGWTEELIRREETEKGVYLLDGRPARRERGRTDYLLRIKVNSITQPVAVALIEAKSSDTPPEEGLEQAKKYARLNNVSFVYSTNGYLFIEYDSFTDITSKPQKIENFPSPGTLRERYEKNIGFSLNDKYALPLLMPYASGEASRRYYQDAAIRSVLEKIARGENRALLYLSTGSGKTFIAVNILKKIADAEQLRRALFLCDRDELRTQALAALQNVFGSNAAPATSNNPQKNARIVVATYQTLNVSNYEDDAKFFIKNYPENYFSHIIIDECHRSAWNKWSVVLTRNPGAIQIGLTATPRYWEGGNEEDQKADKQITADNLKYFGDPVYEYGMSQGIEDGYLPACEIVRRITDIDETGISREDIERLGAKDPITGNTVTVSDTKPRYEAPSYEALIQLPDRVKAWCKDLFEMFLQTSGPHQKTVIFCVRDTHAGQVSQEMNNLYAKWCAKNKQELLEPYAFKCTASEGGSDYIADLRGSEKTHFIATTVDLITTGVDVPILKNVVFFKYVRSPISFQQMLGRGSRIHLPTNKLMFRVYDYTNATRLLGKEFKVKPKPETGDTGKGIEKEKVIKVEGFDVHINPAGTFIVMEQNGKLGMVTVEEYKEKIAQYLVAETKDLNTFRTIWLDPKNRKQLITALPNDGSGIRMLQELLNRNDYDLYDMLAEIGFGIVPKTKKERVEALQYKNADWLNNLPDNTSATLLAMARQFELGGTEELENYHIFSTAEIINAGGLNALKVIGEPNEIIRQAKERLFKV
ncbi:MAG: Type-1 restriction enzyme R protein [Elusimicrobia bacterium ADurb.Bin231]|nr:MAG: Type-1 restriction enzyme R protein [Elusimicrobia bacterium ADurb.Bin231]